MMKKYDSFDLLGYHWTVKPELAGLLKEKVIPLLLSGVDSPHLRVIRRKLTRDSLVVSVPDSSTEIFAKVHKYGKRSERLKTIIKASRARAEWEIAEKMLERELPVPEPLAFGERRSRGLVTGCVQLQRTIPDCVDFGSYLRKEKRHAPFSQSKALPHAREASGEDCVLKAFGGLVRRMHSAGFWHPDLHTGNVLVELGSVSPKLWIVDLHSAGSRPRVSRRRRMADLAKVVFSLRDILPDAQLLEMLGAYMPEAGEKEIKSMLVKLHRAADFQHRRHIRSRSKRCLKTSGGFVVENIDDMRLYRKRDYDSDQVLDAVRRHDEIKSSNTAELVKTTSNRVLTSFRLGVENGERVYVKEFINRGFVKMLEAGFYTHKGRRAWKAGHRLKSLGIPCTGLIALVERRKYGLLSTSYLIMEEVPDAVQVDTLLIRNYFRINGHLSKEEIAEKTRLIRAVAHAVREFHAKKVYHKDMSAKNLLANIDAGGRLRLCFVDVDSIQFPIRLSMRRRIKNLAQLNGVPGCVTATDKLRFYKEYFGLQTLTPAHKFLIRVIHRLSRRRAELAQRANQWLLEERKSEEGSREDTASL